MRKLVLPLLTFSFLLFSCNKNWTCECTFIDEIDEEEISYEYLQINDAKKSEANAECDAHQVILKASSTTFDSCELYER